MSFQRVWTTGRLAALLAADSGFDSRPRSQSMPGEGA